MANKYAQATANWSDLAAAATWFDAASGGNAIDGPASGDTVYLNGQTVHLGVNLDLADYTYGDSGILLIDPGTTVTSVPATWTVYENHGTITTNSGTVYVNYGTVTTNNGTVSYNNIGGTVTNNYGTVTDNNSGGVITKNYGTVTNNNSGGTVNQYTGGTVTTNAGTINLCDTGAMFTGTNTGTVRVATTDFADMSVVRGGASVLGNTGVGPAAVSGMAGMLT